MKIRTRLTLLYTSVVAVVYLLSLVIIYFVSEHTRSNEFYYDLKSEAITKAHLFLQNQVSASTMQSIYINNKRFINEVEVAVYTTDFEILYHDAIQNDIIKETHEMIDRIKAQREIRFYIDKYQGIGMIYRYKGHDYIVTAAAYDGYGTNNQEELAKTLAVIFVLGLTVLFFACYFLARNTLKHIRETVREVNAITGADSGKRLPVVYEKDELGELATAFNALLERLEKSFKDQ